MICTCRMSRPLVSGFDPLPLSLPVGSLGVVEASSHLVFRVAGVALYLLAGGCPAR
jgi:hypothetical protein